ncbi:MAG: hypothetical protein GY926_12320 [bacterium]|nr:hypothetical protein [bacterium]MCP4966007.1 hypothetical protein [bacterium]
MNREERIEQARRRAAEHTPQPAAQAQKRARVSHQRLSNIGASQADRHVTDTGERGTAPYLDPTATPKEWGQAVDLARMITIIRAKRRDTITHSELKWVILDALRMMVDPPTFEQLLLAISPESDGVMLGSIVVHTDSGNPTDDFLLAAMESGFDDPHDVLQRQVYAHFR